MIEVKLTYLPSVLPGEPLGIREVRLQHAVTVMADGGGDIWLSGLPGKWSSPVLAPSLPHSFPDAHRDPQGLLPGGCRGDLAVGCALAPRTRDPTHPTHLGGSFLWALHSPLWPMPMALSLSLCPALSLVSAFGAGAFCPRVLSVDEEAYVHSQDPGSSSQASEQVPSLARSLCFPICKMG